jgi:hypothetical protein
MTRYPYIRVDIYEYNESGEPIDYPVVTHIFRGKTKKEAQGYLNAHMSTDSFLREAMNKGSFRGMPVHVEISSS